MMKYLILRCYVATLAVYHTAALAVGDKRSATSVLESLGLHNTTINPVIGNAASTCKILDLLFPKNETFTSASADYTSLVDEPW